MMSNIGMFCLAAGIAGVKSREDLVMSNTDLSAADPFSAAPFKPPAGMSARFSYTVWKLGIYCDYV